MFWVNSTSAPGTSFIYFLIMTFRIENLYYKELEKKVFAQPLFAHSAFYPISDWSARRMCEKLTIKEHKKPNLTSLLLLLNTFHIFFWFFRLFLWPEQTKANWALISVINLFWIKTFTRSLWNYLIKYCIMNYLTIN